MKQNQESEQNIENVHFLLHHMKKCCTSNITPVIPLFPKGLLMRENCLLPNMFTCIAIKVMKMFSRLIK